MDDYTDEQMETLTDEYMDGQTDEAPEASKPVENREKDLQEAENILRKFWYGNQAMRDMLERDEKKYKEEIKATRKLAILCAGPVLALLCGIVLKHIKNVNLLVPLSFFMFVYGVWGFSTWVKPGISEGIEAIKSVLGMKKSQKLMDLEKSMAWEEQKVKEAREDYGRQYKGFPDIDVVYKCSIMQSDGKKHPIVGIDEALLILERAYQKGKVNELRQAMGYIYGYIEFRYKKYMDEVRKRQEEERRKQQEAKMEQLRKRAAYADYIDRHIVEYNLCFREEEYEVYDFDGHRTIKYKRVEDGNKMTSFRQEFEHYYREAKLRGYEFNGRTEAIIRGDEYIRDVENFTGKVH